ncbi:hypothetical protein TcCL_ESM01903 [Trypanosoma cruzi]|uniref:Uncharacterized protein n=1 Tax=Trypanosoma cruzi (strain CL Brener) TaxID=353153 RepID=Q4E4H3_TRYCC|nr:hypothetical protein, conserved [Trypanosoma cruzi]EAN99681.1 hypothetical protein, conserved [Trypanosoma cruzi]RNC60401.1 hypothetical protein TcCL_ESM01903 [Trypanosoma cruzi]|eukprot:XP_821532.1 hypothetical protein [Trypanosoma cruzi strain CL Brener]
MRQTSVKLLHSKRLEIKQRMLQRNEARRSQLRHAELDSCRAQSTEGGDPEKDAYEFIGREFHCDVGDPAVLDLLLSIEEEIRNEQLVSLYEESQNEDWEKYFQHLARP